jgi:PIN domain nuclease of toxin-antitoxin system
VRLLLDTHTFLFAIDSPERLTGATRELLASPSIERWVSVIALSEIAVKVQKGGLSMPLERKYYTDQLLALNAKILSIELEHCFSLFSLPRHHGDPFDRLLIAQAKSERMTIVTRDSAFSLYDVPTLW